MASSRRSPSCFKARCFPFALTHILFSKQNVPNKKKTIFFLTNYPDYPILPVLILDPHLRKSARFNHQLVKCKISEHKPIVCRRAARPPRSPPGPNNIVLQNFKNFQNNAGYTRTTSVRASEAQPPATGTCLRGMSLELLEQNTIPTPAALTERATPCTQYTVWGETPRAPLAQQAHPHTSSSFISGQMLHPQLNGPAILPPT